MGFLISIFNIFKLNFYIFNFSNLLLIISFYTYFLIFRFLNFCEVNFYLYLHTFLYLIIFSYFLYNFWFNFCSLQIFNFYIIFKLLDFNLIFKLFLIFVFLGLPISTIFLM